MLAGCPSLTLTRGPQSANPDFSSPGLCKQAVHVPSTRDENESTSFTHTAMNLNGRGGYRFTKRSFDSSYFGHDRKGPLVVGAAF